MSGTPQLPAGGGEAGAVPVTTAVLHGVRLLGFATSDRIAARMGLDRAATDEELLDQQAYGRVRWSEYAGTAGWALTGAGRVEGERLIAAELDTCPGRRAALARLYEAFLPVNARLQTACTQWQLRPADGDALAPNDHADPAWDARVLAALGGIATELESIERDLVTVLRRFGGYHDRFRTALAERRINDPFDSCHQVWFELHEDLVATLGVPRG